MKYKEITSFEKACEALNRPANLPDVSALPAALGKYITDHVKLVTIVEAMNFVEENWKPNFYTKNNKYFAWPYVQADEQRPQGFGFSRSAYLYGCTYARVGSRLYFASAEMCIWAQENHRDLFISNYLIIE